jgi:hypothetical protein
MIEEGTFLYFDSLGINCGHFNSKKFCSRKAAGAIFLPFFKFSSGYRWQQIGFLFRFLFWFPQRTPSIKYKNF